jgi:hypothetical protein
MGMKTIRLCFQLDIIVLESALRKCLVLEEGVCL